MPANKVVTVPEEVPLDVAVSCGVQGMTAHYLTHSAHAGLVKPGEWMLIHGTGSGTCQWAAQMAKLRGYKVIGTCSESKQDIARATGVDELIVYKEAQGTSYEDYTSVDLVPKVMEITGGEGVKAVIDGIGLATWETSIEVLARRGIFVSFGNASGAVPAFPPLRFINKSGFLTRPKLNDYTVTREELASRQRHLRLARQGRTQGGGECFTRVGIPGSHFGSHYFPDSARGASLPMRQTLGCNRGHTCAHNQQH